MSIELVSAFAEDRELTAAEGSVIRQHKDKSGDVFYSDLLYTITHHSFPAASAAPLWEKILSHKRMLSQRLGRNPGITVAALDYLSNITTDLHVVTLISEVDLSELANLAMRDGMTGLFNHSSSYELLALDIKNHHRNGINVSLILLDIDDFKAMNDRGGHQEGDRVLVDLARTLIEQTRGTDICCRVGGDEFLIILRNINADETLEVAERIRDRVTRLTCCGRPISISVGIALCDEATTSSRTFMQTADRALYRAKGRGKNQIVLGQPSAPRRVTTRGMRELSPPDALSCPPEAENSAPA